jgi:hypothetical protein
MRLASVAGVALDSAGSVFFSDTSSHRVRKIAVDGTVVTVAGTGVPGFSGDRGPAITAQVNRPGALAFDTRGNLYIADLSNYQIRVVAPDGIINTLAGSGGNGGIGGGGSASEAGFRSLAGIATGPDGSVFVLDSIARRVALDGTIATIAGAGSTKGDGSPALAAAISATSLATDSPENLYLFDAASAIRMIDAAGIIHHFAKMVGATALAASAGGVVASTNGTVQLVAAVDSVTLLAGVPDAGFSGDSGPRYPRPYRFPKELQFRLPVTFTSRTPQITGCARSIRTASSQRLPESVRHLAAPMEAGRDERYWRRRSSVERHAFPSRRHGGGPKRESDIADTLGRDDIGIWPHVEENGRSGTDHGYEA